jgi:hypothetical protein
MDPNENLKEQLRLANEMVDAAEDTDPSVQIDPKDAYRLAELVLALDGWLASRGFYPDRWLR